ncbi:low molecular weight protein tyrosine phosphatase family protein [Ruminococcus albus]|uniref:low molecular weight protein tyrosine phosphatase family protein n=1 Tax=Ruminococcus albus TaxID=1264 RepID=UPI0004633F64|nr:protein-tyrosine-phosphatase [Ruminococcus albus]
MKILFLCSQNKRRSLTAEKYFDGYNGHQVRSAGTENNSRVKVTEGLIGWSDVIFCMEKKHLRRIKDKYSSSLSDKKVICLNIPDEYGFMDEELISLLDSSVSEYL